MSGPIKVIYNTIVLYSKLIIKIIIGLYITRLVLNALGEVDYGIYALVAGVIGMLSFLKTTMSMASMRFLAHSLGSKNQEVINKTFSSTVIINILIGFIVIIIMEIGGLLMFEYLLKVPPDRIHDAKIIFHFMVGSTFVTIISVPYEAVMKAHEDFFALSVIQIIGVIIHLGIAICITQMSSNILLVYGLLVLINQVILRIIQQRYSLKNYTECKIQIKQNFDKKQIKSILSFSGWNVFGVIGGILNVQSRSILLNMFFGVLLNTANGIALSLATQLNHFSSSMTQAINPQIMKSEGGGKRKKMLDISATSAKFSVFLFAFVAIPAIIEMPFLLKIWLKNVPEFAVIFCQLLLINSLIDKFTFQITISVKAVGNLRGITIVGICFVITKILISYFLFKIGYPPYTIYIVNIIFTFFTSVYRLYFGKILADLNIKKYLYDVLVRGSIPLFVAIGFVIPLLFLLEPGTIRFFSITILSFITSLFFIRYYGLTEFELHKVKGLINSGLNKLLLIKSNLHVKKL